MGCLPPTMVISVEEEKVGLVYPGREATVARERRQSRVESEVMVSRRRE